MPIYDRALSPSRMLRTQSTSLLGMGQPAELPGRPPIPDVDVGNVDFIGARSDERKLGIDQQQQITNSLVQLASLAPAAYEVYKPQRQPDFSRVGMLGYQSFGAEPGTFGSPGYASGRGASPLFDLNQGGDGYFDLNRPY